MAAFELCILQRRGRGAARQRRLDHEGRVDLCEHLHRRRCRQMGRGLAGEGLGQSRQLRRRLRGQVGVFDQL
ncbi:hypothetical protein D3C87_1988660 [compost metagenome]